MTSGNRFEKITPGFSQALFILDYSAEMLKKALGNPSST
jgi:hypothetical protein